MLMKHILFTGQWRCKTILNPTLTHGICPMRIIQERITVPTRTANNCTTRNSQSIRVVHQICISPKPSGIAYLCLDTARLNQVFIRPVHRGQTVNGIFLRLTNVHCNVNDIHLVIWYFHMMNCLYIYEVVTSLLVCSFVQVQLFVYHTHILMCVLTD